MKRGLQMGPSLKIRAKGMKIEVERSDRSYLGIGKHSRAIWSIDGSISSGGQSKPLALTLSVYEPFSLCAP